MRLMKADGCVCKPFESVAVLLAVVKGRQRPAHLLPQERAGLQLNHHCGGRPRIDAVKFAQTIQTGVEDKGWTRTEM